MVKWTPKSQEDVEIIIDHVTNNFDLDKAMDIVLNLVSFVESTLNSNPLAGKLLESNPFFSQLVYEGNSIFYCENQQDRNIYIVYVMPRKTKLKTSRLTDDV